ncbi:MAG: extracellular solute-binding protein [Lentisphaerae bacterium]|nr:extracellular solute-binding protein [Lentisphaerota bacterium]
MKKKDSPQQIKQIAIIIAAVITVAMPFIFQREKPTGKWKAGDPVLVIVSPHIAVIRDEFEQGFSKWHENKYGTPVKVDWRAIGGTTEIMRYISGEYISAYRAYRKRNGLPWPEGAASATIAKRPPEDPILLEVWENFREHDDAEEYGIMIDLFFGGGTYDHSSAERQGFTVAPWNEEEIPAGLLANDDGTSMFPESLGGEVWRTPVFYSAVLSGFGICSNPDRLEELGIEKTPTSWNDLTDPRYFGQIGVTDPTKSGSIAKAFEMIIHSECYKHLIENGWTEEQINHFEEKIAESKLPSGQMPEAVPQEYQKDVEDGWMRGIHLVQLIGANARYFTDGAGKVSVDVSSGDAAAGISIDFYSRVQAEVTRVGDKTRLDYITPLGGSSMSGDPISLLRGAPNPVVSRRFIEFVLSEDGQKLWNYRPGTPGGPMKSALRRLPIRRDFYPDPEHESVQIRAEQHSQYTADMLLDPAVDAYHLANSFKYQQRWTAAHFAFFRQLIRAMCMDSSMELGQAWKAIIDNGGPENNAEAMELLRRLPDKPLPVNWRNASAITSDHDTMDYMREWVIFFRESYKEAARSASSCREN